MKIRVQTKGMRTTKDYVCVRMYFCVYACVWGGKPLVKEVFGKKVSS